MTLRTLRWTTAAVVLAAVLVALPLGGARADQKIGVVNSQVLRFESNAGKAMQQALQANDEAFKKEMAGRSEKLQQTQQELMHQQSSLSAEAFAKKRDDFMHKANEFERDVQAHRKMVEQGIDEAARTLQAAVVEIITGIAHENGLAMVLDRGQVIFAEPALDLTQDVLTKLNSKLPTLQVNFQARK